MKIFARGIGVVALMGLATPAWATRVVFISSEDSAKTVAEETSKENVSEEPQSAGAPKEQEKRQRLLKKLEDLYKQPRPEN